MGEMLCVTTHFSIIVIMFSLRISMLDLGLPLVRLNGSALGCLRPVLSSMSKYIISPPSFWPSMSFASLYMHSNLCYWHIRSLQWLTCLYYYVSGGGILQHWLRGSHLSLNRYKSDSFKKGSLPRVGNEVLAWRCYLCESRWYYLYLYVTGSDGGQSGGLSRAGS